MLHHHLTTALRSLLRKKTDSLTSIAGLAIGMACCLLILLFVADELSYDQYHVNKNRIFRLATGIQGSNFSGLAKVNGPWGPAAKEDIPEVEQVARFVIAGQMVMAQGDKKFYEPGGLYADSTTFRIFSFPFAAGDPHTALTEPNSVVLTRPLAEKYFGNSDALGQTLNLDNQEFIITGILDQIPLNSHFTYRYLISMMSLSHPQKDSWTSWNQFYTYFLLKEGASPEVVAGKVKHVLQKNMDAGTAANYSPFLQSLTSIHLHSNLGREMEPNSNVTYLYVFSSIAVLILAISCANFINLATAQASARGKEIGVRKVNGARRMQLASQFLVEAFVISLTSLALAHLLAFAALPALNELTGKGLSLNYFSNPAIVAAISGIPLFTTILAGGYPSVYLSALRPVLVLKGKWTPSGGQTLRKGLAVFQFALSSLLVIASVVILQQLKYIQSKPLGFDPSQIINIPIQDNFLRTHYATVKKELLAHPGIQRVSLSGNLPGGSDWGMPVVPEGVDPDNVPPLRIMAVDPDFTSTYGMEMVRGRTFSEQFASDSAAYLINEEAARQLNWNDPLAKNIAIPAVQRPNSPVVGVVKDFHFRSLHEKIGGLVFMMPPASWYSVYSIKVDAGHMSDALKFIEQKWAQFDPQHPFTYSFFDESYSALYQREQKLARIVGAFTGIGILLACLGLYSLASFTTAQRTKEIGIRKVIGASTFQIVSMLAQQFVWVVVIGFLLALPFSLYASNQWLETFAYRTDFSPLLLAGSCLLTVLVALATVGYRSLRAAHGNPVNSLRAE